MGKKKSAIFLILITLVIAFFCAVCTVSFEYGTIKKYNSAVSLMDKDSQFGGGYNAVYYPDGVISAEEYAGLEDDEKSEYTSYANGSIYLEKDRKSVV